MEKMPENCSICSKPISPEIDAVKCTRCPEVQHAQCVNLKPNDVAYLNDSGDPWICGQCSQKPGRNLRSNSTSSASSKTRSGKEPATAEQVNRLMSSLQTVSKDIAEIKMTQQAIQTELHMINTTLMEHSRIIGDHSAAIARCQADLEDQSSAVAGCRTLLDDLSDSHRRISDRMKSLESGLLTLQSTSVGADNAEAGSSPSSTRLPPIDSLDEVKRCHNLIIAALPESSNDDQQVRKIVDIISPASSQAILATSRLGSSNSQSRNPRLIKVTFSNIITPRIILRNKASLLDSEFKKVSVRDDKSPREIRLLEELRRQLKSRQLAGERDLTIKYVKGTPTIVSRPTKN